jgi:hypothetical protein
MDWKDLEGVIGSAAPLLGGLIGGPAGAAVGSIVSSALGVGNTPDAVSQAISTNPDAAVKLRQIEADQATKLRELAVTAENNRLIAETAALASVNATMQAEDKSDHWPTYAWRPFIGFCVGFNTIAASILVLGVFGAVIFGAPQAAAAVTQLPTVLGALAAISATVLPILGIASYFRGRMQADPNVKTDNRG